MSNPNMETKVKELLELKRMKEQLEAEITSMEDEIKSVMPAAQSSKIWKSAGFAVFYSSISEEKSCLDVYLSH